MALNTRGLIDPRWSYFARQTVRGAMIATVEVKHPIESADQWDPLKGDVFGEVGQDGVYRHYVGPARVQPNNDWRARKQSWPGQKITEHAMRIQIDLTGNTLAGGNPDKDFAQQMSYDAGLMHVGDIVRVTEVAAPYGAQYPVEPIIMRYEYIVRNVSSSSNSWVRTLLCDFIVNNVTPPEETP